MSRLAGRRLLPRMSLTARVAILSALVATVLAAFLHAALRQMLEDRAQADAIAAAEFVTRVAIDPILQGSDLSAPTAGQTERLDAVMRSGLEDQVLRRFKLFDTSGRLVYSDEPSQVGRVAPRTSNVGSALRGQVVAEFADTSNAFHADERGFGRLLEVFVPLHMDGDPAADGVAELYLPYGAIDAALDEDGRALVTMIIGGLFIFWLALFRIVLTASRRLRSELARNEHQALHDALTDLPNRTLLFDRIERAVTAARRTEGVTAVLLLDLDHFKEVNDTLGHHNGDLLLQEVATRFSSVLRAADTLARLGGDEFAVLLPAVEDGTAAADVAHRLTDCLRDPITIEGLSVSVGVSIGIALAPEHADSPQLLLQRADVAMYAAKGSRTGIADYAVELDTYSPDRLTLLAELREAIERNQLLLHYQPKSDVFTGELLGVEALVRWQHPTRGLIPPDTFVPLAEHSGLIDELTAWVLDRALRSGAEWRADGADLTVSVNVSVRNLADPNFPDKVSASLLRHSTPAGRLVLEITETSLMADPDTALDVLRRLKSLGVKLSIDDYGSGYSSLAYIQQLPVDELKIDRGFVRQLGDNERDQAIVRSTIELGRNLGLRVVAEGVENAVAWNALSDLRCDELQGYYLCRPLPAEELLRWLSTYQPAPPRAALPA